jgi:predicted nuclease of predicted toxin-antitoxin system
MKFKIDENLPVELAIELRAAGHNASTVYDEGLQGRPDGDIVSECRREARVLVTLDLDFANIQSYPPGSLPGSIVIRPRWQSKPHILALFQRVIPLLATESLEGHLWIVEESRVRIRAQAP